MEDKQLVYKTKTINFFLLLSLVVIFLTSNAVLSIILGVIFSFFLKPPKEYISISISEGFDISKVNWVKSEKGLGKLYTLCLKSTTFNK